MNQVQVNLTTLAEAAEPPASSSASSNNKNSGGSSSRSRYRGRFSEVRNPGEQIRRICSNIVLNNYIRCSSSSVQRDGRAAAAAGLPRDLRGLPQPLISPLLFLRVQSRTERVAIRGKASQMRKSLLFALPPIVHCIKVV